MKEGKCHGLMGYFTHWREILWHPPLSLTLPVAIQRYVSNNYLLQGKNALTFAWCDSSTSEFDNGDILIFYYALYQFK